MIEALFAGSLFVLAISIFMGAIIYGQESTQLSGGLSRASFVTEEGMEASRNIRDNAFANLTIGGNGLAVSGNQWIFSGAQDVVDVFARQVGISRNILGSGSRSLSVTTTWTKTQQRGGSLNVSSYLTNWRGCRGGILVYGDGGAAADGVTYKVLQGDDATNCTWSATSSAADVDAGTTNRALRALQIYPAPTRHEKVMLSRHYDGTTQYIYAQVYDGVMATWGNVQLLSSWNATTFLDVQNFSGTYLANGDFMVVYSDNTTTPKFRTWNGSVWSGEVSLRATLGVPTYIVARARPGTNEVMVAISDQAKDAVTEYFNGTAYITGNWAGPVSHVTNAQTDLTRLVDFAWSTNSPTKGGLVYNDINNSLRIKIWTADGTGGGSWSASAAAAEPGLVPRPLAIVPRSGADEFIACSKSVGGMPDIACFKSNFTPTWTDPTNQTLVAGTDGGIQRSFHIGFESVSGNLAVAVYSDQTSIPKLKKYTASSSTWDAGATSLNALGAALETVRMIPYPNTDEMMILLGDTNQSFYSVVWDGANDTVYAAPSGYAFTTHGSVGSDDTDFWYDFAWDLY